jgi:hypothetical protein
LLPRSSSKKEEFGLRAAGAAHVGALLPRSSSKKEEFGLRAARAAHVGALLPRSNSKKEEFGLRAAGAAHVGYGGWEPAGCLAKQLGASENLVRGGVSGRGFWRRPMEKTAWGAKIFEEERDAFF